MKRKTKICPFCNDYFSCYNHLLKCTFNNTNTDGRIIYFNHLLKFDCKIISDEYIDGKSLPSLSEAYNIKISEVLNILNIFGTSTRTVKESCNSTSAAKREATMLKMYGVKNASQSDIIKEKKRNTFLVNYGVDNIFKLPGFPEMVCEIMLAKYGKRRLNDGKKIREIWNSFSAEKYAEIDKKRKQTCMDRYGVDDPSKLPERRKQTSEMFKKWWNEVSDEKLNEIYGRCDNLVSSCERKVWDVLVQNNIAFQTQRFINKKSYDLYIHGTGLIIEVQGDYWHANPELYTAEDILSYPNGIKKMATEVWQRDLFKKQNAESYGFKVIYIWETEINFHENNNTLDLFVLNLLYESSKNQCD